MAETELSPVWITLSATEMEIAGFIGAKRRAASITHKWTTTRDFTDSGIGNDVEAVAAEMAVAKALNIYPEWSPSDGSKAVPSFDLKWHALIIDVKSTTYSNGNLLIPKLEPSRIYTLVRGSIPKYEIVGFIHSDAVKSTGQYTNQSYKSCWTVKANRLNPISRIPIF